MISSLPAYGPREGGIHAVPAYRLVSCAGSTRVECRVIREDALTLDIEEIGTYTLMWTPTDDGPAAAGFVRGDGLLGDAECPERLALAVGFAFTEGLIDGLHDVRTLTVCPERSDVVRMQLVDPSKVKVRRRNVVMTSSCGVCGGREALEDGLADLVPVADTIRMEAAHFTDLLAAMRRQQAVFASTGGAHAAAVFSTDREIVATAEDLGRHNALDKVIGICLLNERSLEGCGVVLTSRLSFEMIAKAGRAGFEIVAAISAPSSLAIETADRLGITLCGFVRDGNVTVYTYPQRIRELSPSLAPEADAALAAAAIR